MLSFISLHKENWLSHSYAAACCVGDQVLFQIEYKMESVRLVQVKDRPFSLLWGKKCGFCAKPRKKQLRSRRIYAII